VAGGPADSFTARAPPLRAGASVSGLLHAAARGPLPAARGPLPADYAGPAPGATLGRVWAVGPFGCVFAVVRLPAHTSPAPVPDPLARWLARRPALLAAIRAAMAAISDASAKADAPLAAALTELTAAPLLGFGPADQLAALVRRLQAGPGAKSSGELACTAAALSQLSGASFVVPPDSLFARTMSQGM
jgi:hypothetical protein